MTFLDYHWKTFVQCNKQFNLRKQMDLLLGLSHCIYGEQVWKLLGDFEGTGKKGKRKCYNNFDNGRRPEKDMKKVLLTSLGDEARFSLFALAVGISESCSQILRFP